MTLRRPPTASTPPPSSGQLSTWKEIGAYLGVDVRTAQRYEEELHLPVHRLDSGGRGRVYALVEELDAWKQAKSKSPPWWRTVPGLQRAAAALAGLVVLLAAALFWASRPAAGPVVRFAYQGDYFAGIGPAGKAVWRSRLPKPPRTDFDRLEAPFVRIEDLDGDGDDEVLLWYRSKFFLTPDILMCFATRSGELLWQFTPDKDLRDAAESFSANYHIRDIETLPSPIDPSTRWVALATVAAWGHPSIVSLLDGHGTLQRDYVHSGHLEDLLTMDLDGDGSVEIFAGGHNVSRDQATLVVLSPSELGGASSEPSGSEKQILDLPSANGEIARLFFPQTPVSLLKRDPSTARELYPDDDQIVVQVFEMRETSENWAFLTYVVAPGFSVTKVRADEFMMAAWDQARARDPSIGALDEEELERLGNEVLVVRNDAPVDNSTVGAHLP